MGQSNQTPIPLPVGSYQDQDLRSSSKRLLGCFAEMKDQTSPADAKDVTRFVLRRMAGLRPPTGFGDGSGLPVRGMWEMNGVEYVVIGPNMYSVAFDNVTQVASLTKINSSAISGFGFVRITDNGACMVILQPGTSNAWTYTPFAGGGGWQTLSASFFTTLGAIDLWFVDSFIVFLALNGTTFYNDDGRLVSANAQITFTSAASFTREFGTDLFVGGIVDHREALFFGSRTSEGYVNTGNPTGSPFSSAPDSYMQIGAHPLAAYSVALQDQSVFWVANDKTVRRRNGQTPQRVSNSGIERALKTCDLTGCYALCPTVSGHPLWILTMPAAQRTIVYDCLTQTWFELESQGLGYWRPLCYHNGLGLQLMGDSQSDAVAVLDEDFFGEFGATQLCEFTTQSIYLDHDRFQLRRVEAVVTMGGATSQTAAPVIDLFTSIDSGAIFEDVLDPQNLGVAGDDQNRAIWTNLGQFRDLVLKFRVVDATPLFAVQINAVIERGKW